MKIKIVKKEDINIDSQSCCKIVVIDNKKDRDEIREMYINKMQEDIDSRLSKFYFLAENISENKKSMKYTTETVSEALFDIDWYMEDNGIDDNDFEVIIVSEDEETVEVYKNACKKMALI